MHAHFRRSALVAILAVVIGMAFVGSAIAQSESHNATRLGGGTRFTPPMKDVAALQKAFARPRLQTDLRKVFAEAGIESVTDQFLKAIADGAVKDASVPVGSTMEWMASRSASNARPHLLRNVTWNGKKPFDAFEIVIDDMNRTYTFWIPKVCGNVAVGLNEPSREKARLDAAAAEKARQEAAAKAAAAAAEKARQDAIAKQKAEQQRIEAEKAAAAAAAAAAAKAAADQKAAAAAAAAAAAKAAAEKKAAEEAAAKAAFDADQAQKMAFVIAGFVGKERRTRENGALKDVAEGQTQQSLCAPLFGVKGGVLFRPDKARNIEVGPMVGVAFNTKTFSYTSLFAELELNGRFNNRKTYIGTGIGLWDFTHSDWMTPSILVNFGQQVWEGSATNRLFFTVEGRIFTRMFGQGLANNYMGWAGLRYVFR